MIGIDIGCGYGRLIPWLLDNHCRRVTALDPDHGRILAAKSSLDPDKGSRVTFAEQSIQDFVSQSRFGFVLCSHLVQHVKHAELHPILSKIRSLCNDDAKIVLFTSHSTTGADTYVKAHLTSDGGYREDPVGAEEFDDLVDNRHGVLPIRFFALNTLTLALQKAGLNLLKHYVYHCCEGNFGDLEDYCFRDKIVNSVPELKKRLGRDLALIAAPS